MEAAATIDDLLLWFPWSLALSVSAAVIIMGIAILATSDHPLLVASSMIVAATYALAVLFDDVRPIGPGFWQIFIALFLALIDFTGEYKRRHLVIAARMLRERDLRREARSGSSCEDQETERHAETLV